MSYTVHFSTNCWDVVLMNKSYLIPYLRVFLHYFIKLILQLYWNRKSLEIYLKLLIFYKAKTLSQSHQRTCRRNTKRRKTMQSNCRSMPKCVLVFWQSFGYRCTETVVWFHKWYEFDRRPIWKTIIYHSNVNIRTVLHSAGPSVTCCRRSVKTSNV